MKKKSIDHIFIFLSIIICLAIIFQIIEKNENRPKAVISLTFDDGYLGHYTQVYPLMKEYGFTGTLFLIADGRETFERRELISFEEAKEMQENSWEIGSHSLEHNSLINLSKNELKKDLLNSKILLENQGFEISTLAFPFGDYNTNVLTETKKHYQASRPLIWGDNNLENFNSYKLKSRWIQKKNNPQSICLWKIGRAHV